MASKNSFGCLILLLVNFDRHQAGDGERNRHVRRGEKLVGSSNLEQTQVQLSGLNPMRWQFIPINCKKKVFLYASSLIALVSIHIDVYLFTAALIVPPKKAVSTE